jgi:hypothetical protein
VSLHADKFGGRQSQKSAAPNNTLRSGLIAKT